MLASVVRPISGQSPPTEPVEFAGPITVVSPWTYWSATPWAARFYNPFGLHVTETNTFYLYVHGGPQNSTNGCDLTPSSLCP